MLEIRLPLRPPSLHTLYIKGRIKTEAYRAWQTRMGNSIPTAMRTKIDYPLRMELEIQTSRGDADNRLKAAQDLLEKYGVVANDKWIIDTRARWSDEITGTVIRLVPAERETQGE